MKLKNTFRAVAAAAVMATASLSASAGYVVLDGWGLTTSTGSTLNIGRLNLSSGSATVQQELVGGVVTTGSRFTESGQIYSVTYTKESAVGLGDVGAPTLLGNGTLSILFSNVAGHVTGTSGSGFSYVFDSGLFTISDSNSVFTSGSIVGIGGNGSSTSIIGGFNGDSTLLAVLSSILPSANFTDSLGSSLNTDMLTGKVLFEAVTNNNITGAVGSPAACTFDATAICSSFNVASGGDAYLVRNVPEPGSITLLGLGLVGLGAMRRRKASAK